jgi:hypothetical protein
VPGDAFAPEFVREFAVGSASNGVGFDGPDRLLLPTNGVIEVFDAEGTRMMAADPGADLSRVHVGKTARARGAGGAVYVLDPEGNRLWTLHR